MDFNGFTKALDNMKKLTKNGVDYWMARDIQPFLGYTTWENFYSVIEKSKLACESAGADASNHFRDTTKKVDIGSSAKRERSDCYLSRYACYLIAMNGDSRKSEVGMAQTYFAVQTRRQEEFDQLTADEKRLELRRRVEAANLALCSAAGQAGVTNFALFHNSGYRGLYGMNLSVIKRKKGIGNKESLLDRAGRAELAANEFRITQTEERLASELIVNDEAKATRTHFEVAAEVRNTIQRIGGTMPENMRPEPNIKSIEKKLKDAKKLPSGQGEE